MMNKKYMDWTGKDLMKFTGILTGISIAITGIVWAGMWIYSRWDDITSKVEELWNKVFKK